MLLVGCSTPTPSAHREPACRQTDVPIRWYVPRLDRAVLDRWCATVGSPAVDTIGDSTTTVPPDSLVVVSWNVHAGGGNLEQLVSDLRHGRLTHGRPVEDFVLLIQEALRITDSLPPVRSGEVPERIYAVDEQDSTRSEIVAAARRLGLAYAYVPSMRNGPVNEDRGNAIVASVPLSHLVAIELPVERQRRVTIAANVRMSDTVLTVASVHLENRSNHLLRSFGAGRLRQALAIMRVLPKSAPAVVGGDMNTWFALEAESSLHLMRQWFPRTPSTEVGATYETVGVGRTVDHVFFRLPRGWRVTYRRINSDYGSDHLPVIGVVSAR